MKNKIENQIKEQLKNREIPVAENAWEKLSGMMDEEVQEEKKIKLNPRIWMGIAASFVVLAGLFFFFQMNSQKEIQPEIVKSKVENLNSIEKPEKPIENQEIKIVERIQSENSNPERIPTKIVKNETEISPKSNIKMESTKNAAIKNQFEEMKIPEKELIQNSNENESHLAANENQAAEEPKKSYVDAEMLLYSIENNKSITDTKSESKLVLIDFNK